MATTLPIGQLFSLSTPQDTQRQQLAAQMLMNGQQPVHAGKAGRIDAFSNMIRNLAGAYVQSRAMNNDQERQDEFSSLITSNSSGGKDALVNALAASDNPYAKQLGQRIGIMSAAQGILPGTSETFGTTLQTVTGPDGKPMLAQIGNAGTIRPIQGLTPKEQDKTVTAGGFYRDPGGEWQQIPGYQDAALTRAKASGTNVTVSPTSVYNATEGAASKELYGDAAKRITATYDTADASRARAQQIGQLNQILGDMDTNAATDWKASLASYANAIGLPIDKEQLATVEAARSASGQMVMQQLNAMKGPATEKEREYLQQISPAITNTKQGRQAMQYIAERRAERDQMIAAKAQQLSDAVSAGRITPGEARGQLADIAKQVNAEMDKTFNPPSLSVAASSAAPMPAGQGSTGSWDAQPSASPAAKPWERKW